MKTIDNNIANDYNGFVETLIESIRNALNSCTGQEITRELLKQKLKENPNMTKEEWENVKSSFMSYIFLFAVKESPDLMREMSEHLFNELKKME